MSIITYPLNGINYTADDAETYLCTRVSGVFASEGHYDASVTGDREVTIGTGLAWIQNTDHCGKSVYNDTPVAVTIPVADGALDRIDRIVLRFSKADNASSIVLKEGGPGSIPEAPEVTRTEATYELGLCTISVAASSVTVSSGDITDTRLDEEVCGLMRDGVTGIPTADLQAQAQELIDDLKEEIASIEGGSDVMLKNIYDPAGGERQVAFEDQTSDAFDEDKEYAEGDFCIYGGSLYKFTADHTGEWTGDDVEQTTVGAELSEVSADLTNGAVTQVGTDTVGSSTRPIYLNAGVPTRLSGTVGGRAMPIYLNSGTFTTMNHLSITGSAANDDLVNLELYPTSSSSSAVYIDFHYNDSSSDYTHRIIANSSSGNLSASPGISSSSDSRLKHDIVDIPDVYLALFDKLSPKEYRLNQGDGLRLGFIAQDITQAEEDVGITESPTVSGGSSEGITVCRANEDGEEVTHTDPDYYALDYNAIITMAVAKIKQLEARIEELESR